MQFYHVGLKKNGRASLASADMITLLLTGQHKNENFYQKHLSGSFSLLKFSLASVFLKQKQDLNVLAPLSQNRNMCKENLRKF